MKHLKSLTDSHLLAKTKELVTQERKLTTEILWHLHEIEARRLYAEQGFSSLFDYAVKALGYSEAAAGRRIAAMRLLVEVPEMEAPLKQGAVSLSTLCTAHHFFKSQEKTQDAPIPAEAKLELLQSLEGKSKRECEKTLAAMAPSPTPPAERERVISPELTEIRFVADEALMSKLERIRELDAHVQKDPSYLELFHRLADLALKKLDPEQKRPKKNTDSEQGATGRADTPESKSATESVTPPAERSRHIPAHLKREVWKRDQGRCTYVSPDGRACQSKHALEYDHVLPFAQGGLSTAENLRLRCRAHNQHAAIQAFGRDTMSKFIKMG